MLVQTNEEYDRLIDTDDVDLAQTEVGADASEMFSFFPGNGTIKSTTYLSHDLKHLGVTLGITES